MQLAGEESIVRRIGALSDTVQAEFVCDFYESTTFDVVRCCYFHSQHFVTKHVHAIVETIH